MRLSVLQLVAVLCIISIASPHHVAGQTPPDIAKQAFRSTVLLVMDDANGQPVSLGSGFFVAEGKIASNLHVIEGASRGYAKLIGQKKKYEIEMNHYGLSLRHLGQTTALASNPPLHYSEAMLLVDTAIVAGTCAGLFDLAASGRAGRAIGA